MDIVAHAYNFRTWKVETEGLLWVPSQRRLYSKYISGQSGLEWDSVSKTKRNKQKNKQPPEKNHFLKASFNNTIVTTLKDYNLKNLTEILHRY